MPRTKKARRRAQNYGKQYTTRPGRLASAIDVARVSTTKNQLLALIDYSVLGVPKPTGSLSDTVIMADARSYIAYLEGKHLHPTPRDQPHMKNATALMQETSTRCLLSMGMRAQEVGKYGGAINSKLVLLGAKANIEELREQAGIEATKAPPLEHNAAQESSEECLIADDAAQTTFGNVVDLVGRTRKGDNI